MLRKVSAFRSREVQWEKSGGLVPAIIQDSKTGGVLMLGYMNRLALARTLRTKKIWFYSRSKKRLWMKGETSGNIFALADVSADCDRDALLISVRPAGPACHTGSRSCFGTAKKIATLEEVFLVIESRKKNMPKDSYTSQLFREGLEKICAKVKEESEEVIRAAQKESKRRLIEESADVLYHLLVLNAARGATLAQLINEMRKRRKRFPSSRRPCFSACP